MSELKVSLSELQQIAKERTVKTQNIEYDLETLVKKIDKKVIKLDPEYQRKHRWSDEMSSKLIESLILNIPVPTVYLSQDLDVDEDDYDGVSRYSVIDGQQRLTAIYNFMRNNLALEEMDVLNHLNGCYYRDLPPFLTRRLEERTIKCLRIDSTLDPQVKYDIFERLNSGAVRLEAQELRNAIYRGPFNDLIKVLAKNHSFMILNQIDPVKVKHNKKVQKMEDIELVLRFFALQNNSYKKLKKGFKHFLSERMDELNGSTIEEIENYKNKFQKIMALIIENFGDEAFAKYKPNNQTLIRMSKFNAAVYDALSIALADELDFNDPKLPTDFKEKFLSLFHDRDFFDAISGSVNDRKKVIYRIDAVKGLLRNESK
ncbi:DUF262 domain-containing protein [Bacillus safensis]|uniref:DUF262 domain-containing protein n=1 Tax=Bacillus safensis TaxID=561879 RepID=UPI000468A028|nr:DUF262 domain-containing protein [Bacillus safensis]